MSTMEKYCANMLGAIILLLLVNGITAPDSTNNVCDYDRSIRADEQQRLNCDTKFRVLEAASLQDCKALACMVSANAFEYRYAVRGCHVTSCQQVSPLPVVNLPSGEEASNIYSVTQLDNSAENSQESGCNSFNLLIDRCHGLSVGCNNYRWELSNVADFSDCKIAACFWNMNVFEYNGTTCRFYGCSDADLYSFPTTGLYGAFDIYVTESENVQINPALLDCPISWSTTTTQTTTTSSITTTTDTPTTTTTRPSTPSTTTPTINTGSTSASHSTSAGPQASGENRETGDSGGSSTITPAIIGAVVAGMVCGVLVTVLAVVLVLRCRRKRKLGETGAKLTRGQSESASTAQSNSTVKNPRYISDPAPQHHVVHEETVYDTIDDANIARNDDVTIQPRESDIPPYLTLSDAANHPDKLYTQLSNPPSGDYENNYAKLEQRQYNTVPDPTSSDYTSPSEYSYTTSDKIPPSVYKQYENVDGVIRPVNNQLRPGDTRTVPASALYCDRDNNSAYCS